MGTDHGTEWVACFKSDRAILENDPFSVKRWVLTLERWNDRKQTTFAKENIG